MVPLLIFERFWPNTRVIVSFTTRLAASSSYKSTMRTPSRNSARSFRLIQKICKPITI